MDSASIARLAELVVDVGANIQPGQDVAVICTPEAAPLVHAIASKAYDVGARLVDPWYFDPTAKRIRSERAAENSLAYVPPWYGTRIQQLGANRGARISIKPFTPPGFMEGVSSPRAADDQLPMVPEMHEVVNQATVNWCNVPWPTPAWASFVYPDLKPTEAYETLVDDLVYILRLDDPDPVGSWRSRFSELDTIARTLTAAHFDRIRFEGPGTDLTIGLLPSSRFTSVSGWTTQDGVVFANNLPSEEVLTTPDPCRADGYVTATRPLDLNGTLVQGLRVEFEHGRATKIDATAGAEALRNYLGKDRGATHLGELALVDRESRIGKSGRVFFNNLLDENAACHLAFGNAYAFAVGSDDSDRINKSAIHLDFMVGSNDVQVTGITADGKETPLLRDGSWQLPSRHTRQAVT